MEILAKKQWHRILACLASAVWIAVILCGVPGTTTTAWAAGTGKLKIKVAQDNARAQEILKYVNKYRKQHHLSALKLDTELTEAAVTRGAELNIMVPYTSPHRRPDGRYAHTVNKRINYEDCLETTDGWISAKEIVDEWMDSPSHKKGILLPGARSIGIGAVYRQDSLFNGELYPDYSYQHSYTLEISRTAVKKTLKSSSIKKYTKSISTKKSDLKKKYFSCTTPNVTLYTGNPTWDHSIKLWVNYSGPHSWTDAHIDNSSFTWKSSNPSVASVNKQGLIKAVKPGTAAITFRLKSYSKVKLTVKVSVQKAGE